MIASVRSTQAASAACGTALASATRLHHQVLRRIMGCDRTTQPGAQERGPIPPPGGLRYSAHMVTRRELLLGTAGGWLVERVWAGEAADSAPDTLTALTGKKPLIRRSFRPPNFETPLAELAAPFTRNDAFFVRYHLAVIPQVDPAAWRLQIAGASAQQPAHLVPEGAEERLRACQRGRGQSVRRQPAWALHAASARGAMGQRCDGQRTVARRAVARCVAAGRRGARRTRSRVRRCRYPGPARDAGFPEEPAIERALDDNTLIALEMNGQPLPHWNGAPARLIVPGWVATYWVKHLTSIRIEPQAFDGFWMKTAYRVPTGAFPGSRFTSQENADTTPVTELMVNSLITSHVSGARLPRGERVELAGKAWDSGAGIEGVEVSADHGQSWREATLQRDLGRFAWREFRFPLDTAKAGPLEMSVRARSRGGAKQPDKLTPQPFRLPRQHRADREPGGRMKGCSQARGCAADFAGAGRLPARCCGERALRSRFSSRTLPGAT